MQYAIIDNFLDIDYFNSIKKIIMSDRFAWYFQDGITNPETGEEEESFYFTHNVYSEGVKSSLFTHLEILLQKLNVLYPSHPTILVIHSVEYVHYPHFLVMVYILVHYILVHYIDFLLL